jgi:hypothetical protein
MPKHVFKIEDGRFGLTTVDPGNTDICAETIAGFDAFTCQITNGMLTATPNVTTETIDATWCDPEETNPQVGATSYNLDMSYLQDPDLETGLSRFLFENDTREVWFFMGLAGDNPPKARGKVRVVAGAIGGGGRTALTSDISLPVVGKPAICFGDETSSTAVGGGVPATTAVMGSPGTYVPYGSDAPANLAAAIADLDASPSTDWTVGTYITLGDGSQANWNGTTWVAGVSA